MNCTQANAQADGFDMKTSLPGSGKGLPRLAMVADVREWAFDNIAQNLRRVLSEYVDISVFYLGDEGDEGIFKKVFLEEEFDYVHFLWRVPLMRLFSDLGFLDRVAHHASCAPLSAEEILSRLAARLETTTVTCGVYDHTYLDEMWLTSGTLCYALVDGYNVSSARLFQIYGDTFGTWPFVETPDGVDSTLYKPQNLARFSDFNRPLVIGWVGNSAWQGTDGKDKDSKGLNTILDPAIRLLETEGLALKRHIADRKDRWRSRAEMPGYYSEIDVLVCSSRIEGTPNPVLEAMSCGVPVVSTDVGIVPEILGPLQKEFIVSRDAAAMADALRKLYADRARLQALSAENLAAIQAWSWSRFAPRWLSFFAEAQARRLAGHGKVRGRYAQHVAKNYLDCAKKNSEERAIVLSTLFPERKAG